ncbi:hypothetical protein DSO57_1002309 [Entomophthora muscae]|uniref:Uncharacterized protein n=1 Tax=Entomophthora muscae TaxID=34485 RepID=A0ACC2UI43_9FUNG|nr:hypothetical protein DSO57_1002309 [Entomophthora muscae]
MIELEKDLVRAFSNLGLVVRWAHFFGTLDFTTLGGAGFASQKILFKDYLKEFGGPIGSQKEVLDLSSYDGLSLSILKGDGNAYCLNLYNTIGEVVDPETGKRESVIEFKYSFTPDPSFNSEVAQLGGDSDNLARSQVYIPFKDFLPYYRGRLVDAEIMLARDPSFSSKSLILDSSNIKALSMMCQSGFGKQSGSFSLFLESIFAYKN